MIVAAANLRMGNYRDAIEICDALLKQTPAITEIDDMMRWRGLQATLIHIRHMAQHPSEIDISLPSTADPVLGPLPDEFMKM